MNWDTILTPILNGLFVGIGSTIGTWIVTKHFIRNLEKLEEKIKEKK